MADYYQKEHIDTNLDTGLTIYKNPKSHKASQSISVCSFDDGTRATASSGCSSSFKTNIHENYEDSIKKKAANVCTQENNNR